MRAIFTLFIFIFSLGAQDSTESQVNDFLKRLDGNYKERKQASKELNNLPVDFYPYLKKHLAGDNVSIEVKLRLTKDKMFPLRAKWLQKSRMDWYRKHTREAYEQFGHKDPKWDKDVQKAFDIVLKQLDEYWYISDYATAIGNACQQAVKKGCKDPLILYFLARGNRIKMNNVRNLQLKKMHLDAAKALKESKYHDYFKFRANRLAAYYTRLKHNRSSSSDNAGDDRGYKKLLESITDYNNMLKDKNLPFPELFYNSEQYCNVFKDNGRMRAEGLSLIKPILKEHFGPDSMELLAIEGSVGINIASSLRSKSYKDSERANKAAIDTLALAWKKDPAQKDIAARVLKVIRKEDDKGLFDEWYNKVLLADPGNLDAFNNKLDFLSYSGSIADYWAFIEEIVERGGTMVKRLPILANKLSIRLASGDDKYLFDFDSIYQNDKLWQLLESGFAKYKQQYPDDRSIYFNEANYAAHMGYWDKAHSLFQQAGDLRAYKGSLKLETLREQKLEASIYKNRGIKPLRPHFMDFDKRIAESLKKRMATCNYDFWKFYSENNDANEKWDAKIKEALDLKSRQWYGDPTLKNDLKTMLQKSHKLLTEVREAGNKDPFIYMMWADLKDGWFKGKKSHYFEAAKQLIKSKYPDHIKALAICMGINKLGYINPDSQENNKVAVELTKILPAFINKDCLWPEQYYYLFEGLKDCKLLSKELAQPIIDKYLSLKLKTSAYMIEGHFNNRMAWYTHSLSKKKNWKLINQYNRKAKESMRKAWLENPLNPYAAEYLYRMTDRGQGDYVLNLRRALYTSHAQFDILKKFMRENNNAHSRTLKWARYPHTVHRIETLHYEHTEIDAKRKGAEPDVRKDHWNAVSKNFESYLEKYPNDTLARSRYALFAIKTPKLDTAKVQLQILGEYAIPWVFGGNEKLKEYQEEYLKENSKE